MSARAYYNEIDPFAAEWLRMLILDGLIAPGDVDTRSIEDVRSNDLIGYTQCHFFAGIGGWSYALRLAGWPDSRPVWTLSCPCQPFSTAGKEGGFSDERHLWPAAHWLIAQRRPVTCFGEQVASPAGLAWLDLVQADMENTAYSTWAADICAAGVGAPHIRQRLYWRADSRYSRVRWSSESRQAEAWRAFGETAGFGDIGVGTDATNYGSFTSENWENFRASEVNWGMFEPERACDVGGHNNPLSNGWNAWGIEDRFHDGQFSNSIGQFSNRCDSIATGLQERASNSRDHNQAGWLSASAARSASETGATRGFWSSCDWWYGRDEKYRPIEPGLFPLAHGVSGRVGKLRGYGNAIVPELAAAFIEATERK